VSWRAYLSWAVLTFASLARAQQKPTWPLWAHYADRFVDPSGRVIDFERNQMTTSEGQAYGMFFALVGNDPERFAQIYAWTEQNLAGGNIHTHLCAWSWGKDAHGRWGVLDANSAADADLWIAYSLLQAGRLWNQPGYSKSGIAQAALIRQKEVLDLPSVGPVLLPAAHGFRSAGGGAVLNPSYVPVFILPALDEADPKGPWRRMAAAFPAWLQDASPHFFAMDWIAFRPGTGFTPISAPGHPGTPALGSYDAIRVYLWCGVTHPDMLGRGEMLEALNGMTAYMADHDTAPESVDADGHVVSAHSPAGFAAALVPFLQATAPAAAAVQQRRVEEQWNPKTGLYGPDTRYYDQNLAMFSLGWSEHRYEFAVNGKLRVRWEK
jgi:endo-1,4-beta-D-glucanase Y